MIAAALTAAIVVASAANAVIAAVGRAVVAVATSRRVLPLAPAAERA